MKVIDDSTKKLHWWNRNYFFLATILVVLVNILLYGLLGSNWRLEFKYEEGLGRWFERINFSNIVRVCFDAFAHADWQHVLLNMLCFFICGLYLERKMGSLSLLGLVLAMTFFTSCAIAANFGGDAGPGFSGVNFGLYAYILVDYLFVFRKRTRTKFNMIAGAVMLALIYFAMCYNGDDVHFGYKWYPHDLLYNMGHYSSALVGLVLGLFVQIVRVIAEKEQKRE